MYMIEALLLTAKAPIRSQARPCWTCNGQSGTETGFILQALRFRDLRSAGDATERSSVALGLITVQFLCVCVCVCVCVYVCMYICIHTHIHIHTHTHITTAL